MNLHRWLVVVTVILILVGCVQMASGPGQASCAPNVPDDDQTVHDRGGDGGGGSSGM